MASYLAEIAVSVWPQLRDKFLADWPYHSIPFYTIDNFIKWKRKDPGYPEVKIYCLNGDWEDGTHAVVDDHKLFIYTLSQNLEHLTTLVSLLPQGVEYLASNIDERHLKALTDTAEGKYIEYPTWLYQMAAERASGLEVTVPAGLCLKPVNIEELEQIHSVYPYPDDHSFHMFEKLHRFNLHFGVFDENNRLLAWCFRYQSGLLTALQVHEFAKKRGLGSVVVRAISRALGELGEDSIAAVVDTNYPAMRLFEKIGYTNTRRKVYWIEYYRPRNLQ